MAWGFNYSRGDRLLEDYWDTERADIEQDSREIKALGANVVRIHLQYAEFMQDPATPDEAALDKLEELAALAEETGLYLDVTGLGAYRAEDTPEWYFSWATSPTSSRVQSPRSWISSACMSIQKNPRSPRLSPSWKSSRRRGSRRHRRNPATLLRRRGV